MVEWVTAEKECIICLESLKGRQSAQDTDKEHATAVLSCNHSFHNSCLKFWIDRCSSCPLCRTDISHVRLVSSDGAEESYPVTAKAQVADYDDFLDVENALDEELWICPICNSADHEDLLLICDGCESACYHTYCVGLGDVPESEWFCPGCAGATNPSTTPRLRTGPRRRLRRNPSHNEDRWSAAWSRVWDRLNADLQEYPSELSEATIARREEELRTWTDRIMTNRMIASSSAEGPQLLDRDTRPIEERRAWSSFEKARRSLEKPASHTALASEKSTPKTPKSPGPSRALKRPSTKDRNLADVKRQKLAPTPDNELPSATHFLQSINKTSIRDNLDSYPLSTYNATSIPEPPTNCLSRDPRSPELSDSMESTAPISSTSKAIIQKAVREALHPHYRDGSISKAEFTEINRRVSRSLYASQSHCDNAPNETWLNKVEEDIQVELRRLK